VPAAGGGGRHPPLPLLRSGPRRQPVAEPAAFDPGNYTFYGRYVGFDASDERRPVGTQWAARFITGGAFDGGTQLLVWRDGTGAVAPVPCGSSPSRFPLGENLGVTIYDESGQPTFRHPTSYFDLAIQRVDIRAVIDPPAEFGWMQLIMTTNVRNAQGWVGWVASAQGRFSAGLEASEIEVCVPDP
jgi:hypothetical protein